MKNISFMILLCFSSCALFKKTSKTSVVTSQSVVKQTELSQFLLKHANKETHIFTYWGDSGIYQVQNIKEQLDETKAGTFKTIEKQLNSEKIKSKESKPIGIWFLIGIAVFLMIAGYFIKRWKS